MGYDLSEVDSFFQERILGWMMSDLKRSVDAGTNFLTALGCLTYTEAIGTMLPPIDGERGSIEEKRFYRCLFRLPSGKPLRSLDLAIRKDTSMQRGLYKHLRHSAAHLYAPQVRKERDGHREYMPVVVAKVLKPDGCPPMWQDASSDGEAQFYIGTKNYVQELDVACNQFYQRIITARESVWVSSALKGLGVLNKGLRG
jgi:hypothetical protein